MEGMDGRACGGEWCAPCTYRARWALQQWVQNTQSGEQKWTRHTGDVKRDHAWEKDTMIGGRAAKMLFLVGGCQEEKKCMALYDQLYRVLPRVGADVQVCTQIPQQGEPWGWHTKSSHLPCAGVLGMCRCGRVLLGNAHRAHSGSMGMWRADSTHLQRR